MNDSYFFLPNLLFFIVDLHKGDNHGTKSVLCCLEISSVKEICPLHFNLTSHRFLGRWQKADSVFAKIEQELSLAQLPILFIFFPSETSWVGTTQDSRQPKKSLAERKMLGDYYSIFHDILQSHSDKISKTVEEKYRQMEQKTLITSSYHHSCGGLDVNGNYRLIQLNA